MTKADELVRSVLSASQREHVDPADLRDLREVYVRLKEAHEAWDAADEAEARPLAERCIKLKRELVDVINRCTMSEAVVALFTRDPRA